MFCLCRRAQLYRGGAGRLDAGHAVLAAAFLSGRGPGPIAPRLTTQCSPFLTALSSFFPMASASPELRASLFLIVIFLLRTSHRRILTALIVVLLAATMVNVVFTLGSSRLGAALGLWRGAKQPWATRGWFRGQKPVSSTISGDTIEQLDGRPRKSERAVAALTRPDRTPVTVQVYRVEWTAGLNCRAGIYCRALRPKNGSVFSGVRSRSRRRRVSTITDHLRRVCTDHSWPSACSWHYRVNEAGTAAVGTRWRPAELSTFSYPGSLAFFSLIRVADCCVVIRRRALSDWRARFP